MGKLRVIVFDVEHGLCIFVRTPTGYAVLIDCGRSPQFSPVQHVVDYEIGQIRMHGDYLLALMIVTHPHGDHVRDINSVATFLSPAILKRRKYPDWDKVRAASRLSEQDYVDQYVEWQEGYSRPVDSGDVPDWGMRFNYDLGLRASEAEALDSAKFVNNSSIIVTVEYAGRKFLIGGDAETPAWEKLLQGAAFRDAVSGTDFFITPHHGHESGFCADLFSAMGKPYLNIASVHSKDEHVATQYSQQDYAIGVDFGGDTRRLLTTRTDGSVFVEVDPSGNATVRCQHL